jgi:hypothetical protein
MKMKWYIAALIAAYLFGGCMGAMWRRWMAPCVERVVGAPARNGGGR